MRWARFCSGCLGLAVCLAPARADRTSNWKMFKAADGLYDSYATAVTVSPRGNVWVKHGEGSKISVFDGYQIQTLPSSGPENNRVYESRTGQLWTLYPGGLAVYSADGWVYHPVAEIRTEIQADLLRQLRPVPLVPAERDRVLFLLSDRLMEYDSGQRRAVTLKYAVDTRLGRFFEMTEARDGGIWVTGSKGLAKFPGPLRHLRPGTPCDEFLLPDSVEVEYLQRPFEDGGGAITVAAIAQGTGKRLLLQCKDGAWNVRTVEASIRQAWQAWDEMTWGYTMSSLLRFDPPPRSSATREKLWAGQYRDVATETNDVFWLATSEGLLRYAPTLWRTPVALEDVTTPVHALHQDSRGNWWLASSENLFRVRPAGLSSFAWPEGFEGSFDPLDALYELPNGLITVTGGARSLLFNPDSEKFQLLTDPDGQALQVLGQALDGWLIVQLRNREDPSSFALARFDGQRFERIAHSAAGWNVGAELRLAMALSNGDLWLSGNGGLARLRQTTLETFGPAQGIRDSRTTCLSEVSGGRLWCGNGDRILEFSGRNWTLVRGGFDHVNAIVRGPDDKTWVATDDGLYCYANGTWLQHGMEDGLPDINVSKVFIDPVGNVWAGTTRGVSRYHPEADLAPPRTLPPLLDEAGSPRNTEQQTILFSGIDKWQNTSTARLLYSTRLDEGPWSPYANSPSKTFSRLGAGKHHLEVRAMDRNWNEDPSFAALDFSVVLAWYKDPRLIGSVVSGTVLVFFFAGLAVNRHIRLKRSYAEVERIVAQRTAELERANEELVQSQKMRALGTLAAGIAHDFNNMLSIIKGSAQIIASNLDDKKKILTRLNRIQAVVEQGSGIVKSILGLSRVKEQDLVKTNLNSVVEDSIRMLGDKFLHETTIHFRRTPDLPAVLVARELIQQMLLNLILNAADAMDGKGEVVVSTGEMFHIPADLALAPARAVSYVYLSVQDSGCGIPAQNLPRIFEPFFTTKALSARRGTGLGLSIVYELARQMGYGLEVRSAPTKGSTFSIILPARDSLADL